jgi:hypothetical protein
MDRERRLKNRTPNKENSSFGNIKQSEFSTHSNDLD